MSVEPAQVTPTPYPDRLIARPSALEALRTLIACCEMLQQALNSEGSAPHPQAQALAEPLAMARDVLSLADTRRAAAEVLSRGDARALEAATMHWLQSAYSNLSDDGTQSELDAPVPPDPMLSSLRRVSVYYKGENSPDTQRFLVHELHVDRFVAAVKHLHVHPGVNPANGERCAPVWRITVSPLQATGPYWWSTPDLQRNYDPAGAVLFDARREQVVFVDPSYLVPELGSAALEDEYEGAD